MRSRASWFSAVLVVGLASSLADGCVSSPEPVFYALSVSPGEARSTPAWRVAVRRPELPRYLDRPQIVERDTAERLELSAAAHWAAPLDDMLRTTLIRGVGQRLPRAQVYAEAGVISLSPDVIVEIEVLQLERMASGRVRLAALVALSWPVVASGARGSSQPFAVEAEAADAAPAVVDATSALLSELADVTAQLIARGPPSSG